MLEDNIQIRRVSEDFDSLTYRAELSFRSEASISKQFANDIHFFEKVTKELKTIILTNVYQDVIAELEQLRLDCFKSAQASNYDGYRINIDLATKLGEITQKLRYP
jgi:hypothetical protein